MLGIPREDSKEREFRIECGDEDSQQLQRFSSSNGDLRPSIIFSISSPPPLLPAVLGGTPIPWSFRNTFEESRDVDEHSEADNSESLMCAGHVETESATASVCKDEETSSAISNASPSGSDTQTSDTRRKGKSSIWAEMGYSKMVSKTVSENRAEIERLEKICGEQKYEMDDYRHVNSELKKQNAGLRQEIVRLKELQLQAGKSNSTPSYDDYDEMKSAQIKTMDTIKKLQGALALRDFEVQYLGEVVEEQKQKLETLENCHPATLRSLLIMRHVEQASIEQSDEKGLADDGRRSNWVPTGLPEDQLDKVRSPGEIQSLAKLLPKGPTFNNFYARLKLDICTVCSKAKLKVDLDPHPQHQSIKWLHEYVEPSRYFTCCQDRVCKQCFKVKLLDALEFEWWNRLETLNWFKCPRPGCGEQLHVWCEAYLEDCLALALGQHTGRLRASRYVKMYPKALIYREALKTLETVPNEDALKTAARITCSLIASGHMYSPFDTRFDPKEPDETGCLPELKAGSTYLADVDRCASPVPLFLKLFRRQSSFKECIACGKRLFDIAYGSIDNWKIACADFKGPWMWKILSFPTSETQKCKHDFDVCRTCTAEHIRTTLESGGSSSCDNLTCPQCSRKLEYAETVQLADIETVAKYDKYLFRNYLSKQENFRWCLNPICTNGQVYDYYPRNPRISCEVCDFEMCFTHSVPWHEETTCAEYDSVREHGDPSYDETQEWIKTNTKPCPNIVCGTSIQKGEACFHMTCSQCQHEFCWQCLASWCGIRTQGQEGHEEGCFFRTNNVSPMEVQGENLEAALGRVDL